MLAHQLLVVVVLYCAVVRGQLSAGTTDEPDNFQLSNNDEHHQQFRRFVQLHQKNYANKAEKQIRFAIFKKNMLKIAELNKRHNATNMFGITKFADWTDDEFQNILIDEKFFNEGVNLSGIYRAESDEMLADDEKGIDWRKKKGVSPVRDQGSCGSCWTFSTVAAVESQWRIKRKSKFDLSEQQLLDCVQARGCNGGPIMPALEYVKRSGLDKETNYKYKAEKNTCHSAKKKYKIDSAVVIKPGLMDMKSFLLKNGPFIGGLKVPESLMHYTGGLYEPTDCDRSVGLHAWLVVGLEYNKGKPFWIIKNSWGKDWGEKGYIRLAAGNKPCATEIWGFGALLK